MTTLYDQIGGQPSVEAAVDLFYGKVLGDVSLKSFFDGVDMTSQTSKMKAFLTRLLSGTASNVEDYMRNSHRHLVDSGLNDSHFDAVAGHLQATLEELSVPGELVAQIIGAAAGLREPILNR